MTPTVNACGRSTVLGLIGLACASGGTTVPPPPPPPIAVSLEISPGSTVLEAFGATRQLLAQVRDQHGAMLTDAAVGWEAADPTVATVSINGLVTAITEGVARIVASHGELRDTATIMVAQRAVSLVVSTSDTVLPGLQSTAVATVIARDARGHAMPGATPTWSTSLSARATVSPAGLVTAVGSGKVRLMATFGALTAGVDLAVYGITGEGLAPVDDAVTRFLAKHGIPGAAVAITHQGRLVHARGYGLADTLTRRAVTPKDPFRLASLSKSITAVALMHLIEDGVVSLDDGVFTDWLPDLLPPAGPADARLTGQTIRHLLQHAGGWNHPPNDPMFSAAVIAGALGVPSPPSAEQIVRYMGTQALQFAPGTSRAYSNVGYATLGRIIARASGQDYVDFVRTTVFDPIGATTFGLARSLADQRAPGEVSYYHGGAEMVLVNSVFADRPGLVPMAYGGFHLEALDATGGWLGSAPDLARFLLAVDGRTDHPDLITPASRALLGLDPGLGGNLANYGMGWFRIGPTMFGTGRLPGQASLIVIDELRELTWVLLLNWSLGTVEFSNEYANVLTQVITSQAAWPAGDLFGTY